MAPDGWEEWSKYVLKTLEELSESHKELHKCVTEKFQDIRIDIATLKVKAGIWGLLGGMIPIAVVIALWIIKSLAG